MEPQSAAQSSALRYAVTRWTKAVQRAELARTTCLGDRLRLEYCCNELASCVKEVKLVRGRFIPSPSADELLKRFKILIDQLGLLIKSAVDSTVSSILRPVSVKQTGGRPSIHINPDFLRICIDTHKMGPSSISKLLCSRPTYPGADAVDHVPVSASHVRKEIVRFGLRAPKEPTTAFTKIGWIPLLSTFRAILLEQPKIGLAYLTGRLRSLRLHVPRDQIRKALRHLRPLPTPFGAKKEKIKRRKYKVSGPGSMWHLDGQHELIMFGIVVHGITDGHTRAVVGLKAATNNTAATFFLLFIAACLKYGVPSRMRGDRGGENLIIAAWLCLHRGVGRGSFLWGTSPHNTRIERLWPEVVRLFLSQWLDLFCDLQQHEGLDPLQDSHKWLLSYLFLGSINTGLAAFQAQHNHHPLSSANNKDPNRLLFEGMVTAGVRGQEPDGPLSRVSPEDVDTTAFEFEVNQHVHLPDPRCPFADPVTGYQRMATLLRSASRKIGHEKALWVRGAHAMMTVMAEESDRS